MPITAEYLREVFDYEPDTGKLIWAKPRPHIQVGREAGNVSKSSKGYRCVGLDNKVYKAHRLIWLYMTGDWPKHQIDHINGVKDDNRWCNLREATTQQNCFNKGPRKDNTSGERNVFWCNTTQRWKVCINRDKYSKRYQRSFRNKQEAIDTARKKRAEIYGDFNYSQS